MLYRVIVEHGTVTQSVAQEAPSAELAINRVLDELVTKYGIKYSWIQRASATEEKQNG